MKRFFRMLLAALVLSACPTSCFLVRHSRLSIAPSFSRDLRTRPRPLQSSLQYRDTDEEADAFVTTVASPSVEAPQQETGVNMPTFRSIALSQALALIGITAATVIALAASSHPVDLSSIHWNGSNEFTSFWDFSLTTARVAQGVIATVPMIYFGSLIDQSDHRDASHVNFSTMNMVMSLFGRRKHEHKDSTAIHPPETPMMDAIALSSALAVITGVSEEIVFRGFLPSMMFYFLQSVPLTLFGQSVLFGLGHLSPHATFGENKIIGGHQAANGLWYGLVYLATGGDLLPCIIAHILYDIHVFVATWMNINDQMDYTEESVLKKLPADDEVEIRRIKQEAGPSLTTETLAHARRFFYAFDYEHRGSLSLSDVKRAVSYAFLQDKVQPDEERVGELFERMIQQRVAEGQAIKREVKDRLKLPEFLRLLFLLKARSQTSS